MAQALAGRGQAWRKCGGALALRRSGREMFEGWPGQGEEGGKGTGALGCLGRARHGSFPRLLGVLVRHDPGTLFLIWQISVAVRQFRAPETRRTPPGA